MIARDDIERELSRIGAIFDPVVLRETRAMFRPLVEALPWANRPVVADLAYGLNERQRIDVYPCARPDAPVLLFIHGGGFIGGDKANDPPFYGNVGRYFAEHGYCAAAVNYRLAPAYCWPSGASDVALAIDWIVANIAEHGGDPTRLLLLGQSAGASHALSYLFDPRCDPTQRSTIKAAVLMSGFYSAMPPPDGGPRIYFGDDETGWVERSPITHVASGHLPMLLSVAQWDPAVIASQTLALAQKLNDVDQRPPRTEWLGGQNHVSAIHGLGLDGDRVGPMLCDFYTAALTLG